MSFGRDGASATVGPVCWQKTHNPLMKTSKKHPNLLLEGLTPQRRTEILIPHQQNWFLMRLEDFKQLWLSPAPSKTRSNVFKMRRADRLIPATVFALRHTVKAPHTHFWPSSLFHSEDSREQILSACLHQGHWLPVLWCFPALCNWEQVAVRWTQTFTSDRRRQPSAFWLPHCSLRAVGLCILLFNCSLH